LARCNMKARFSDFIELRNAQTVLFVIKL